MAAIFLTTAAIAQESPHSAQGQSGRLTEPTEARIPVAGKMSDAERGRVTLDNYAVCLVNQGRKAVEKALAPSDVAMLERLNRIVVSDCLYGGDLRFKGDVLRGALYTALYRADFSRRAVVFKPEAIKIDPNLGRAASEDHRNEWIFYLGLADCVVRSDPISSRSLILGPSASSGELAAFAALPPAIGACLKQGAKITFSRTELHGLIAEALFLESQAATRAPAP